MRRWGRLVVASRERGVHSVGVRWTGDVSRGAWIAPQLSGWASRDSVAPGGFPAYARIFHSGVRYWWDGPVNHSGSTRLAERPVTWAEVAELTGAIAHPWMQWGGIARVQMAEADLGDGTSVDPPEDGRLPREVLELLLPLLRAATATPGDVTAAVWEGWGELHSVVRFGPGESSGSMNARTLSGSNLGVTDAVVRALAEGSLLQLPDRNYLLFEGALTDLSDSGWTAAAGLGDGISDQGVAAPQLLWPADHAWYLATEIDVGFTLLAGSAQLVEQVLTANGMEAALLDHDGDLSWDADTRNPRALDRR